MNLTFIKTFFFSLFYLACRSECVGFHQCHHKSKRSGMIYLYRSPHSFRMIMLGELFKFNNYVSKINFYKWIVTLEVNKNTRWINRGLNCFEIILIPSSQCVSKLGQCVTSQDNVFPFWFMLYQCWAFLVNCNLAQRFFSLPFHNADFLVFFNLDQYFLNSDRCFLNLGECFGTSVSANYGCVRIWSCYRWYHILGRSMATTERAT